MKKILQRLFLGAMALALALTAAPAFADRGPYEGYGPWRREERREFRGHEWWEHERSRHRHFRAFARPYYGAYCYPRRGFWAWNGWRYVRVPSQTVCE